MIEGHRVYPGNAPLEAWQELEIGSTWCLIVFTMKMFQKSEAMTAIHPISSFIEQSSYYPISTPPTYGTSIRDCQPLLSSVLIVLCE